jgi:hypothetical protein
MPRRRRHKGGDKDDVPVEEGDKGAVEEGNVTHRAASESNQDNETKPASVAVADVISGTTDTIKDAAKNTLEELRRMGNMFLPSAQQPAKIDLTNSDKKNITSNDDATQREASDTQSKLDATSGNQTLTNGNIGDTAQGGKRRSKRRKAKRTLKRRKTARKPSRKNTKSRRLTKTAKKIMALFAKKNK